MLLVTKTALTSLKYLAVLYWGKKKKKKSTTLYMTLQLSSNPLFFFLTAVLLLTVPLCELGKNQQNPQSVTSEDRQQLIKMCGKYPNTYILTYI